MITQSYLFVFCLFVCLFVFKTVEWSMFAYFQVADNNLCSFKSDSKLEPTCCSPPFRVDLYLHAVILSHRYNAILPPPNSKSGNPKISKKKKKEKTEEIQQNWRINPLAALLLSEWIYICMPLSWATATMPFCHIIIQNQEIQNISGRNPKK